MMAFVATVDGQGGQSLPQEPAFEVASVKPSASRDTAMRIDWPRGRFSAVNVTTRQFIEAAYKVEPFRVHGGPSWITTIRFNIDATIPADVVVVQGRGSSIITTVVDRTEASVWSHRMAGRQSSRKRAVNRSKYDGVTGLAGCSTSISARRERDRVYAPYTIL